MNGENKSLYYYLHYYRSWKEWNFSIYFQTCDIRSSDMLCSNMELYQAGFVYIWLSLMALSRISRMSRVNIHLMAWRERTDKLSNGSGIWNVHPSIECCQNTRFTESRHARLACIAHPCHTLLSAHIPPNTKWLAPGAANHPRQT